EDITKITTKYINDKRDILVSIIGYTNIDKENENEKISDSKNYANIIADKLNKKGLDKNLMIVEYRGGKDNLYTNETSYSKDLSNRVMVAIYVLSLKDSDKDGVFDITDECPETPLDRVVDDKGCQLDSDKDGVLDYKDECPNTPQGFTVNSVGCPTKKDLMLNFDTASWKILESSNQIIAEFVEFLKQNPAYNIKIIGHTDSVGKDKANLILSDKRAESLKSAFIDQGIDGTKITTQGLGESSPVASNDTKDGRYKNRRTVIELIELIK
ncbi:MAG: OmpA family protein, partial [Campylobacterota bacterium]|nr:OmpA family protein [Campylobacterota bacterium]